MQEAVGNDVRLIRVMPNTPCLVGETASAMCLGGIATEDDAEVVRTLFSAVGTIFKVLQPYVGTRLSISSSFALSCACSQWSGSAKNNDLEAVGSTQAPSSDR